MGLIVVTVFLDILVVSLSVGLAVAGMLVVRRFVPFSVRDAHNAAAGMIYAALYVMFGLSVGFSLFLVWQQFEISRTTVEDEANNVFQVYALSANFPEPERSRIQDLATSYARTVVEDEWPLMQQGRTSPRAAEIAIELRASVEDFQPHTEAGSGLYSETLTQVDQLEEQRALRLLDIRQGIPAVLWVVLVTGGTLTIAFTYLFGMREAWLHGLTVAALTVLIALLLFTIGTLNHPFDGDARVRPDAFEAVQHTIEETGKH